MSLLKSHIKGRLPYASAIRIELNNIIESICKATSVQIQNGTFPIGQQRLQQALELNTYTIHSCRMLHA